MRKFLKDTAFLSFTRGIFLLSNMVLVFLLARHLSIEEYSDFRKFFLPYEILSPILILGLSTSIQVEMSKPKQEDTSVLLAIILISCSHILFLAIVLGSRKLLSVETTSIAHPQSVWSLPVFALLSSYTQLLIAVSAYKKKLTSLVLASLIMSVTQFAILALWIYLAGEFFWTLWIRPIAMFVFTAPFLPFVVSLIKSQWRNVSTKSLLFLLSNAFPIGISAALGALAISIDKLVVALLGTDQQYAVFINGAFEFPLLGVVTGAVATVLLGTYAKNISSSNEAKALNTVSETSLHLAYAYFPIFFILIYFSEQIVVLAFGELYRDSHTTFMIYLCLVPLRIITFSTLMAAMGQGRMLLLRALIEMLLNAFASILFFYVFGLIGPAIATVMVSYLFTAPFSAYWISRGLNVSVSRLIEYRSLAILFSGCVLIFFSVRILTDAFFGTHSTIGGFFFLTVFSCAYMAMLFLIRLVKR